MVVDDSTLMRSELGRLIEQDPRLKVIGTAANGMDALEKLPLFQPDVLTLDINMPVMDGLATLKRVMAERPLPVIMISTLTVEGAEETLEALNEGAFDYVQKPGGDSRALAEQGLRIREKIIAAARSKASGQFRNLLNKKAPPTRALPKAVSSRFRASVQGQVVGVGVSTGGPKTLMQILPQIPADFPGCIVIAQHMPKAFTASFATRLDGLCPLTVTEAQEGDVLEQGHIYLAPGGGHMQIEHRGGKVFQVHLLDEVPGRVYKPSVDVLFESLNEAFSKNWIGVILTGMGADGAEQLTHLKKAGGHTIAQSEESCVVFGMPGRVVDLGGAEFVLPDLEIAGKVLELTGM